MTLVRQNTDYAFRVLVSLARRWPGEEVSARVLAEEGDVSYQFACKILQSLHEGKLVESSMGPKGGYRLSREPSEITMQDVVGVVQGPIKANKCMLETGACDRKGHCPLTVKMEDLEDCVNGFLKGVTLAEMAGTARPTS